MNLNSIKLYRITHIKNIKHIVKFGITNKYSKNANKNFIDIGSDELIEIRNHFEVVIDNGEFFLYDKVKKIILGDFIPFYFFIKMPMLYKIQKNTDINPQEIVYLVIRLKDIMNQNFEYYFSDGHAISKTSNFYDKNHIKKIVEILDWKAIMSKNWNEPIIKKRKQAEFLIREDIPEKFICNYICYDESSKQKLIEYGVKENKIIVDREAYY
ncbi:MAG: hypothetical protein KatS3mg129_2606 [Leptospiraceae bacterium]|nr:MAG: hypothetical protein KatS3mg129_2606 [Leptospiraceae bacterium]